MKTCSSCPDVLSPESWSPAAVSSSRPSWQAPAILECAPPMMTHCRTGPNCSYIRLVQMPSSSPTGVSTSNWHGGITLREDTKAKNGPAELQQLPEVDMVWMKKSLWPILRWSMHRNAMDCNGKSGDKRLWTVKYLEVWWAGIVTWCNEAQYNKI